MKTKTPFSIEQVEWELVNGDALARIANTHRTTIERWRDTGRIPPAAVIRWGSQVRYSLKVLEAHGFIQRLPKGAPRFFDWLDGDKAGVEA